MSMRKIFPPTAPFVFVADGKIVATNYVAVAGFEDMMRAVAVRALKHAKLNGCNVKAFFGTPEGEPELNAYPQGYTEVYR